MFVVKILRYDSSSYKLNDFIEVKVCNTLKESQEFVMEKHGTIPFSPGDAYWLDISNNHAVVNNSDQPRWHIIVHQKLDNEDFKSMVVRSYHMLYINGNENG